MSNVCKLLYVENRSAGVRNCFAKQKLGVGAESCLYFLVRGVRINKCTVDTQFLKRHCKEVECAAIYFARGDKVVARFANIKHSIEVGCLSA